MLAFFFSLFRALCTGEWAIYRTAQVNNILEVLFNEVSSMVVNAIGGNFEAIQTFDIVTSGVGPLDIIAAILAIAAMISVCLAVFKLTKMVFSIFFGGR